MYEAGGHWFETLSEYLEYRVTTLELGVAGGKERREKLEKRLEFLEALVDRQRDRVSSSFKNHLKRIESLESDRKDIQFLIHASNQHKKRIEKIENYHQASWAKKTTHHLELKPHTCGECKNTYHNEADSFLACFQNENHMVKWVTKGVRACGKFSARGESCI